MTQISSFSAKTQFVIDVTISHFFQSSQLEEMRYNEYLLHKAHPLDFAQFHLGMIYYQQGMKVSLDVPELEKQTSMLLLSLHSYEVWIETCCLGHLLQDENTERTRQATRLGCWSASSGLLGSRYGHILSDIFPAALWWQLKSSGTDPNLRTNSNVDWQW